MAGTETIDLGIPEDDTLDQDLESVDEALAREEKGLDQSQDAEGTIKFVDDDEDDNDDDQKMSPPDLSEGDDDEDLEAIVFDDDGEVPPESEQVEDDDFEEEDNTPKAFKNRLGREQRLKSNAYKERDEYATANDWLVGKLTEERRDNMTTRRTATQTVHNAMTSLEESLETTIRLAGELGDDDVKKKAEEELLNARQSKQTAEGLMGRLPSEDQIRDYVPNDIPEVQQRQRLGQMAQDWMDQNGWMSDDKHAAKRAAVMEIDKAISARGISTDSPEYYKQLSIEVAKEFPTLEVRNHDGRRVKRAGSGQQRTRGGSVNKTARAAPKRDTAAAGRRQPVVQRRGSKGTIVLNSAERGMMETLGLDFTNKEHVKEFRLNHKPKR